MRYKALICDVDGTLVPNHPDGLPSEKVKEKIKKVRDRFYIGIATSRPYWMLEQIVSQISLSCPCIINGGTQIIDPINKQTLWEQQITHESFQKALTVITDYSTDFYINEGKKILSIQIIYKLLNQ